MIHIIAFTVSSILGQGYTDPGRSLKIPGIKYLNLFNPRRNILCRVLKRKYIGKITHKSHSYFTIGISSFRRYGNFNELPIDPWSSGPDDP